MADEFYEFFVPDEFEDSPLKGKKCLIKGISLGNAITLTPGRNWQADVELFRKEFLGNLKGYGLELLEENQNELEADINIKVQLDSLMITWKVECNNVIEISGNISVNDAFSGKQSVTVYFKKEFYCEKEASDWGEIYYSANEFITATCDNFSYKVYNTLKNYYLTGNLAEPAAKKIKKSPRRDEIGPTSGYAQNALAGKFDRTRVVQFLVLAALIGFVIYRYVEPYFPQTLRPASDQAAAPAPAREKPAEYYFKRGFNYFDQGHHDQAMADFNKAIDLDPKYAKAYNGRGSCYAQKDQWDQAMADFNNAIELDPKLAEAYINRGTYYAQKGQIDQALQDFNRALEIDPKYPWQRLTYAEAYYGRGSCYQRKGQYDQAISEFSKALDLNPKSALACYSRGLVYFKKGQYDQAIHDFNEALKKDPKLAKAYSGRGACYIHKGQWGQALADFNRALELDPNLAKAYGNRGAYYARKGQLEQAMSDYNKALEIDPRFAMAYHGRAFIYFRYGDYDKAWEDVRQAQNLGEKINPNFLQDLRQASGRQN